MKKLCFLLSIFLVSGCSINSKVTLLDSYDISKRELPKTLNKHYIENNIKIPKSELDRLYKRILVSSQDYPDFKTANLFTVIKFSMDKHPPKNKDISSNITPYLISCNKGPVATHGFGDGGDNYYLAIFKTINKSHGKIVDLRYQKNLCFHVLKASMTYNFKTNKIRVK